MTPSPVAARAVLDLFRRPGPPPTAAAPQTVPQSGSSSGAIERPRRVFSVIAPAVLLFRSALEWDRMATRT